jgi:ribosomal protein S18 acetylase RimI-like enzyme
MQFEPGYADSLADTLGRSGAVPARGCCAAGQCYRAGANGALQGLADPGAHGHDQGRCAWPAWPGDVAACPGEPGKMGVMEIRPARMQDAPEIAVVHVRSWQAAYRGLLPQAYLDGLDPAQRTGRWEQAVSAADSHGGTVVADAGGRLSGFVSYGPARDDDADSRRAGEIYAIYLAPAAWDQGIGRQLMAAALGRLGEAGFNQALLWVLDSNARARRFYEAGGWIADGAAKRDDSFGVPMTEVRYRRSLP